MSRKALDILFASGGALLAITLLVLGFVMMDQAAFADDYVKDELGAQRIVFPTEDKLTEEEKNWQEGSSCLVKYAGQTMETGKQAECYGKYYIGMHMRRSAANAAVDGEKMGWDNETYATLGGIRTEISAKIAAAKEAGNTEEAAKLQKQLDAATSLRSTMQTGETLKGLLLTTYGFHSLGDRAGLAGTVAFIAAAILAVVAIGGFVHAFLESKKSRTDAQNEAATTASGKPIQVN